ncbi:hypothetical protein EST38_g11662 [Candolleomyces aberdarensis]|uniref:Uncharacterized protein n=1 Tax=Candolleomyces aberdarensis TaxID=2316362 RepID=A0A4Q2D4A8_9AGAR|nr:hypothetical protein EST38_g11662 [Candolleomyces aberdarensis]
MRVNQLTISGSTVITVIEGDIFQPGDMDLFVPQGSMGAITQFLADETDYVEEIPMSVDKVAGAPRNAYTSPDENGIVDVKMYIHPCTGNLINLVETKLPSSPSAVMLFHSTMVMNFITWNSIVSAYPWMLADRVGLLNSYRYKETRKVAECLQKYKGRGFQVVDAAAEWIGSHTCRTYGYCGHTIRSVLDRSTMRLCFESMSNMRADVVDSSLTWLLACRVQCEESSMYCPEAGWIRAASGECLVKFIDPNIHVSMQH